MTVPLPEDEKFMALALTEARKGLGLTSPNPAVGAVLVQQGQIIGTGWHRRAGQPHAEVEALRDAALRGHSPSGATAYVTLEPCSTHGRTGACTQALIAAGVQRVVYGATDPNPAHIGAADRVLQAADIATTSGVLQEDCQEILRPFTKWITTGLPYVIAKCGQTLDGRITRPSGESSWITSETSRAHAMQWRIRSDAILIGGETLRRDNPNLTLRGPLVPEGKVQPWRVVVTRSGDFSPEAYLFTDAYKERTLVLKGERSFHELLQELAARQITCVLLECGGRLMAQAFAAHMVDEVHWYVAPRIGGGGMLGIAELTDQDFLRSAILTNVRHQSLGDDFCMSGYPQWSS